jgi:hypothetical protein
MMSAELRWTRENKQIFSSQRRKACQENMNAHMNTIVIPARCPGHMSAAAGQQARSGQAQIHEHGISILN